MEPVRTSGVEGRSLSRSLKMVTALFFILSQIVNAQSVQFEVQAATAPQWSKNQPIYEVDIAKITPQGTFKAFEGELPRLKKLGVGIIWLMPIHERGKFRIKTKVIDSLGGTPIPVPEANRSYGDPTGPYNIHDHYSINSAYGTPQDFKDLVAAVHENGMYLILDWVLNHTSWDHVLIEEHPDFYAKDSNGVVGFVEPWKDIAQLDFSNKAVWEYMIKMSEYWVEEYNLDGFRTDVADRIPAEFWEEFNHRLEKTKPLFLLAEGYEPENHPALDATYDWFLPTAFWSILQGKRSIEALDDLLAREQLLYPKGFLKMRHATNHDTRWMDYGWPSWAKYHDQVFEHSYFENTPLTQKFGPALKAYMVLCATLPNSIPMIWNGQEFGKIEGDIGKRNAKSTEWIEFYTRLFALFQNDQNLGAGTFKRLYVEDKPAIYAFTRSNGKDKTLVMVNFSKVGTTVEKIFGSLEGNAVDVFSKKEFRFSKDLSLNIEPWGFKVIRIHQK